MGILNNYKYMFKKIGIFLVLALLVTTYKVSDFKTGLL